MTDFTLTPITQLLSKPYKPNWLIKDHMEQHSIGMLFGAPASAKSLLAMDIAFCIAAGIDWNGNDTVQGSVVYLAGEGFNGIKKRFKALGLKYSTTTNDLFISESPASFMDPDSADAVKEAIDNLCPEPALIVIDTLHRNFGNGDENSSKDFAKFLSHITKIMNELDVAVLIVHHSGHGTSDRSRGSSSINAALDVEYKVTKDNDLVTMDCTKYKEFQKPKPMSFNLEPIPIPDWLDDDGKPIESAILKSTTYTAPVRTASIMKKDLLVLQALTDATANNGVLVPDTIVAQHPELAGKKYIHIDDWRKEGHLVLDQAGDGTNQPRAKKQAFNRSKDKLLDANKIATQDDYYWEAA